MSDPKTLSSEIHGVRKFDVKWFWAVTSNCCILVVPLVLSWLQSPMNFFSFCFELFKTQKNYAQRKTILRKFDLNLYVYTLAMLGRPHSSSGAIFIASDITHKLMNTLTHSFHRVHDVRMYLISPTLKCGFHNRRYWNNGSDLQHLILFKEYLSSNISGEIWRNLQPFGRHLFLKCVVCVYLLFTHYLWLFFCQLV